MDVSKCGLVPVQLNRGSLIFEFKPSAMQEQEFSPHESLHLIESMINKARNRFSENGHLFLLWGWVILLCSIANFISAYFFNSLETLKYIWILIVPTVIYQIIYLARKEKNEKVKTYADEIYNYVWVAFVIMGFVSGIILGKSGNTSLFNPVILSLYGMPTFLSGVILQFSPLKIGAFCCWGLAIAAMFIPMEFSFLLLAIAVITAWIVPGYLLRSRYKNQN
jgi:uncharacterized membrane protein YfcA